METDTKKRVLKIVGYASFVFMAFLFFLYQTFPYHLIVQRATNGIQRRAKLRIKLDKVSPYWFSGVSASGVNIRAVVKKGTAEIQIDEVTARLSILSLITGAIDATFSSSLAKGSLKGNFSRKSKINKLKLSLDSINLATLGPTPSSMLRDKQAKPLLAMLFAPVYGRLSGEVDLELPEHGAATPAPQKKKAKPKKKKRRNTRRNTRRRNKRRRNTRRPNTRRRKYVRRGINLQNAVGEMKLNIRGFSMGPGYFPAGQMGELPVPLLRLGNLLLKLKLAKGRLTIIKAVSIGEDVELHLTGHILLKPRLKYSIFQGKVKFKIKDSFKNRPSTPPLLKGALQMLGPTKTGFHNFKIYMPFRGRPRFQKL